MQSFQQLVENLKRLSRNQKLQIAFGNEKLNTILSLVNASQNSRQRTDNTHSSFQPLIMIIAEKFYNIQKDETNNYFRKETTTKAEEPLSSLQKTIKVKKLIKKDKVESKTYFHLAIM